MPVSDGNRANDGPFRDNRNVVSANPESESILYLYIKKGNAGRIFFCAGQYQRLFIYYPVLSLRLDERGAPLHCLATFIKQHIRV